MLAAIYITLLDGTSMQWIRMYNSYPLYFHDSITPIKLSLRILNKLTYFIINDTFIASLLPSVAVMKNR